MGDVSRAALPFALAAVERERLVVDLVGASVVAHRGVEARFAVEVQEGRLLVGVHLVEVEVFRFGVGIHRKPVLRVVHLHQLERRNDIGVETRGVVGVLDTRPAAELHVTDVGLVARGPQVFGVLGPCRFDEQVVVIDLAPLGVGKRRCGGVLVEFIAVLLGQFDRLLCCRARLFPLFGVVILIDEVPARLVFEPGVELRVAVHQRAGGIEQYAGFDGLGCHGGCAAQFAGGLCGHHQGGGLVQQAGYEGHALVVGTALGVDHGFVRLVLPDLALDDHRRTVVRH